MQTDTKKITVKKKHKYIEVRGNTIIVKTPVPYRVVRQMEFETVGNADDKEYRLNSACSFLYDCMRLLGVTKKQAKEQGFTLNIDTGDKILHIAARKEISHEMFMTIKNYNW